NKVHTAAKSFAEDPTPASMWQVLTGGPLTDEVLEWPADLFALTNLILKRTEAYRFVLSPPCSKAWPPMRFPSWSEAVEDASRQWTVWLEDREVTLPELLVEEWTLFWERAGISLEDVAEGRDWRMCEALLTLHAIADEACAGLGAGFDKYDGKGCLYRAR